MLPVMRARHWGRIVNITSVSAKQPIDNLSMSNVLRPGVARLAKTLSVQLAAGGITINNVAPGHTRTDRVLELAQARALNKGKTVEEVLAATSLNYLSGREDLQHRGYYDSCDWRMRQGVSLTAYEGEFKLIRARLRILRPAVVPFWA